MLTAIVAILMYKVGAENGVWLVLGILGDCYIVRTIMERMYP